MGVLVHLRPTQPQRPSLRENTLAAMLADSADLLSQLQGADDAERYAIDCQVMAIRELVPETPKPKTLPT